MNGHSRGRSRGQLCHCHEVQPSHLQLMRLLSVVCILSSLLPAAKPQRSTTDQQPQRGGAALVEGGRGLPAATRKKSSGLHATPPGREARSRGDGGGGGSINRGDLPAASNREPLPGDQCLLCRLCLLRFPSRSQPRGAGRAAGREKESRVCACVCVCVWRVLAILLI